MKDDTISRAAAIDAMMKLQTEDIEAYGASIPEGFDGDRAVTALKALPSAQPDHIGEVTEMVGDAISRQGVLRLLNAVPSEEFATKAMLISGVNALPSAQPVVISKSENTTECEDAVPRTSVEYICRKNTVSTNPYEHKYHDKFIQFMDDPEISDFGRWQHSNGFNTALVAVKCDLDKVPSVTPKQPGWIPCKTALPEKRKYVLCQCRAGIMDVLRLTDDNGWYKDSTHIYMHGFVLAWMPLPKPWEGGQDNGTD